MGGLFTQCKRDVVIMTLQFCVFLMLMDIIDVHSGLKNNKKTHGFLD